LGISDNRIAKILFKSLIAHCNDSRDSQRYNWAWNFKKILDEQFSHLFRNLDPMELIKFKADILERVRSKLKQQDIEKAKNSTKHFYTSILEERTCIKDINNLNMLQLRLIAQLRLNLGSFRIKGYLHELELDSKCQFCNLESNEDLFHFLFECKIHQSSRNIFLKPLFTNINVDRSNCITSITKILHDDNVKIFHFINCSLKRRKLMIELAAD